MRVANRCVEQAEARVGLHAIHRGLTHVPIVGLSSVLAQRKSGLWRVTPDPAGKPGEVGAAGAAMRDGARRSADEARQSGSTRLSRDGLAGIAVEMKCWRGRPGADAVPTVKPVSSL